MAEAGADATAAADDDGRSGHDAAARPADALHSDAEAEDRADIVHRRRAGAARWWENAEREGE